MNINQTKNKRQAEKKDFLDQKTYTHKRSLRQLLYLVLPNMEAYIVPREGQITLFLFFNTPHPPHPQCKYYHFKQRHFMKLTGALKSWTIMWMSTHAPCTPHYLSELKATLSLPASLLLYFGPKPAAQGHNTGLNSTHRMSTVSANAFLPDGTCLHLR